MSERAQVSYNDLDDCYFQEKPKDTSKKHRRDKESKKRIRDKKDKKNKREKKEKKGEKRKKHSKKQKSSSSDSNSDKNGEQARLILDKHSGMQFDRVTRLFYDQTTNLFFKFGDYTMEDDEEEEEGMISDDFGIHMDGNELGFACFHWNNHSQIYMPVKAEEKHTPSFYKHQKNGNIIHSPATNSKKLPSNSNKSAKEVKTVQTYVPDSEEETDKPTSKDTKQQTDKTIVDLSEETQQHGNEHKDQDQQQQQDRPQKQPPQQQQMEPSQHQLDPQQQQQQQQPQQPDQSQQRYLYDETSDTYYDTLTQLYYDSKSDLYHDYSVFPAALYHYNPATQVQLPHLYPFILYQSPILSPSSIL